MYINKFSVNYPVFSALRNVFSCFKEKVCMLNYLIIGRFGKFT